jgi:hypothetical protein
VSPRLIGLSTKLLITRRKRFELPLALFYSSVSQVTEIDGTDEPLVMIQLIFITLLLHEAIQNHLQQ